MMTVLLASSLTSASTLSLSPRSLVSAHEIQSRRLIVPGVPLLCIPLVLDQYYNTRQVARLGTGVALSKTTLTTEKVVAALSELLENAKYRENARKLRQKLQDSHDSARRVFLESVEFAAKHPDVHKNFALDAVEHNILAAHGYDVIIVMYTIVVLLVCSLYWFVCRTCARVDVKAKIE